MVTDKQLRYMMSIRQILSDYDTVIGGEHTLPTPDEVWSMSKEDASKFISKYAGESKECWKKLMEGLNN